jgi:hypothetical protein
MSLHLPIVSTTSLQDFDPGPGLLLALEQIYTCNKNGNVHMQMIPRKIDNYHGNNINVCVYYRTINIHGSPKELLLFKLVNVVLTFATLDALLRVSHLTQPKPFERFESRPTLCVFPRFILTFSSPLRVS